MNTNSFSSKENKINVNLIAPCGMNCRLCWGYLRKKNTCPGCRQIHKQETDKSKFRTTCIIRNCSFLENNHKKFCSPDCKNFPCLRLKQLDKRYKTKYNMSMIENLNYIDKFGVRKLIQNEKEKWKCSNCNKLRCVHKPSCVYCGC